MNLRARRGTFHRSRRLYIISILVASGRHLELRGYGGFDRVPMLPSPDEVLEAIRASLICASPWVDTGEPYSPLHPSRTRPATSPARLQRGRSKRTLPPPTS